MKKTLIAAALVALVAGPAVAAPSVGGGWAAKQAYEMQEMAQHNRIASRAPKEAKHPGYLPVNLHQTVRTGIFPGGPAPVRGFNFVNVWQGQMNGQQVDVYAGSVRGNARQGVLVVMAANRDLSWSQPRIISLGETGPAKILGAVGTTLMVGTPSGRSLTFQVPNPATLPQAPHGGYRY